MGISFNKSLGLHESSLTLRVDRAKILSSNLANADTPNFKARDINFQQALIDRMGTGNGRIGVTKPGHTPGHIQSSSGRGGMKDLLYRNPSQPSINGNTVEEDSEHAEFMKNNMEFQIAFTLLNSKFKGLRKAVKGE